MSQYLQVRRLKNKGLTQKKIAEKLGISLYRVQGIIHKIHAVEMTVRCET